MRPVIRRNINELHYSKSCSLYTSPYQESWHWWKVRENKLRNIFKNLSSLYYAKWSNWAPTHYFFVTTSIRCTPVQSFSTFGDLRNESSCLKIHSGPTIPMQISYNKTKKVTGPLLLAKWMVFQFHCHTRYYTGCNDPYKERKFDASWLYSTPDKPRDFLWLQYKSWILKETVCLFRERSVAVTKETTKST